MKVVMEYTFKTHEDYFKFMEETEDLAERGELHFRAKTISTTDDDVPVKRTVDSAHKRRSLSRGSRGVPEEWVVKE